MDFLKEVERITKDTAYRHGVDISGISGGQIKKTGVSQESGSLTLAVPPLVDIFRWDGETLESCTPCFYFQIIGKQEGSSYDNFRENFNTILQQQQSEIGFYIVNHNNMRSKFIGQTWKEVCNNLDGKYVSSDTEVAISDRPCNINEFKTSFYIRRGLMLIDSAANNA